MRLLFLSRTRLISLPNAGAPTITPKSKAALTARDVGHCGYSFCKASPLDFSRVMCPQARPDSLEFFGRDRHAEIGRHNRGGSYGRTEGLVSSDTDPT